MTCYILEHFENHGVAATVELPKDIGEWIWNRTGADTYDDCFEIAPNLFLSRVAEENK